MPAIIIIIIIGADVTMGQLTLRDGSVLDPERRWIIYGNNITVSANSKRKERPAAISELSSEGGRGCFHPIEILLLF